MNNLLSFFFDNLKPKEEIEVLETVRKNNERRVRKQITPSVVEVQYNNNE